MNTRRKEMVMSPRRALDVVVARVAIGAAGAPTLVEGIGVSQVVRTAQGRYTVTFDEPRHLILGFSGSEILNGLSELNQYIEADSVSSNPSTCIVRTAIETADAAALADPANGTILIWVFWMSDSSITGR